MSSFPEVPDANTFVNESMLAEAVNPRLAAADSLIKRLLLFEWIMVEEL